MNQKISKNKNIFNYSDFINKEITVHFIGKRKVSGILKCYDQYSNLIFDNTIEYLQNGNKRELGLIFIKGTSISNLFPSIKK